MEKKILQFYDAFILKKSSHYDPSKYRSLTDAAKCWIKQESSAATLLKATILQF